LNNVGAIVFLPCREVQLHFYPLFYFVTLPLQFQNEKTVYPTPLSDVNGVKYDKKDRIALVISVM
jgi:hypothetical protein